MTLDAAAALLGDCYYGELVVLLWWAAVCCWLVLYVGGYWYCVYCDRLLCVAGYHGYCQLVATVAG